MNLAEFIDKYKNGITRRVVESYPPLYRPSDDLEGIPRLLRKPMGGQSDAIRGTALSLRESPSAIVAGEMGTGKTFIGAAAAYMAGFNRVLVLCPPHLVQKWKREVEETIPRAMAMIVKTISDLETMRSLTVLDRPLFVIMSRERAKLSYRWKSAIIPKTIADDSGVEMILASCPDCAAIQMNSEGIPFLPREFNKRKRYCRKCGGALWTADRDGPKRYPLSDYIKRYFPGFFELFIGDEVHEYKGRGSAQGIAAGVLAEKIDKSLTLTGTLMGGYSSTLFHLLYRFSPDIRVDFGHSEESRWVQKYGFLEKTINYSMEEFEDGRSSKRKGYRTSTREKPGITPASLFHLINNSVFLRLTDVASGLPTYEEQVMTMDMSSEIQEDTGWSQLKAYSLVYQKLYEALVEALLSGSARLLSIYLQTLLAYPDAVYKGEDVWNPEKMDWIVRMPPLAEDVIYPKEQALIDLVKSEKAKGRKVMVYITHTGTRDITGRVSNILQDQWLRVAVLKADTVAPEKREAWIQQKVAEGVDAVLCHPRLVQTGLDLIDFPTLCWYETDYSVYTMRQASRRSWRIGQRHPVRVVFMCYNGALQADALALVSRKLQSSLAVEGELPEDGLASYADDGEDLMMMLARRIVNLESESKTLDDVFRERLAAERVDEELLVDADWYAVVEEPETEPKAVVFTFNAEPPDQEELDVALLKDLALHVAASSNGNGRKKKAAAPVQTASLFDWALSR